ncbi:MAG: LysM domain-containing protein [Bradymonadales bacterium]|nr:MAG: LysM domain-containing protein [Bradymonadales bacterium]
MELVCRKDPDIFALLYRVQNGDTISRILYQFPALKNNPEAYRRALQSLKLLNPHLTNLDLIFPGDILLLPPFTRFTLGGTLEAELIHQAQEIHESLQAQDHKTKGVLFEYWPSISAAMKLALPGKTILEALDDLAGPLSKTAFQYSLRPIRYIQTDFYRLQQIFVQQTRESLRILEINYTRIEQRSIVVIQSSQTRFRDFARHLKIMLDYAKALHLKKLLPIVGYTPEGVEGIELAQRGRYADSAKVVTRDIIIPVGSVGIGAKWVGPACIAKIAIGTTAGGVGAIPGTIGCIGLGIVTAFGLNSSLQWGFDWGSRKLGFPQEREVDR